MTVATTNTNKATVQRIYEDLINARRFDLASDLVDADYVGPTGDRGTDGFVANVRDLVKGFPDITFTIEDLVAEGDRVVARWSWAATHAGQFRAYAATGTHVTNSGIVIYQLHDGRVVRSWLETDRLGALQQIGAIK